MSSVNFAPGTSVFNTPCSSIAESKSPAVIGQTFPLEPWQGGQTRLWPKTHGAPAVFYISAHSIIRCFCTCWYGLERISARPRVLKSGRLNGCLEGSVIYAQSQMGHPGAAKIARQRVIPAMQKGDLCEVTAIASRDASK